MTKIDKTLKFLGEKLKGIDYALIGSANLYIQGLDVEPKDIDILTTSKGLWQIAEILKNYQTKKIYFDETEGRNSYRTFFKINGIEIEALGNVNNLYRKKDSLKNKTIISHKGIKFFCISLEEELKTYEKMGRCEKVKLIREYLNQ